ncbi:tetraspanin-8-like [Mugil cephalus]|uniref:tetraspanin-8-like n=1 Tax=Mugil cephalus TaxID=48193 RepID=UPI001FB6D401|nr:tetraspanin-8-like [Mugil cephalus]
MGKVNVCLKRSCLIVLSLIAIISLLMLGLALYSHGYFHREHEAEENAFRGLHAIYVISAVTLALTIIAVFGICKEKKWALIVFTVIMILSCLYMLVTEIMGLALQKQFISGMKQQYMELLPLANASESEYGLFHIQREFQCCGLDEGYRDWGYDIPESCVCTIESTNPCVEGPRNSTLYGKADDQPVMIYAEACLPLIIAKDVLLFQVVLSIMLIITLLWVLSVVLCIAILCQLNRKPDTPAVVYSAEAKAGNYTTLTDAADYT